MQASSAYAVRSSSIATKLASARSIRGLRRLLREYDGCVGRLDKRSRRLLILRAGVRGHRPHTLAWLSRRLNNSRTTVRKRIRRATKRLMTLARTTGCAGTAVAVVDTGASGGGTPSLGTGGDKPADRPASSSPDRAQFVDPNPPRRNESTPLPLPVQIAREIHRRSVTHPLVIALLAAMAVAVALLARELGRGVRG